MSAVRKHKILVVDDEENIRIAISRWFDASGYEVDIAVDGQEALEKCLLSDYDLLLMDLEMPRMGGKDALKAIRHRKPEQRFIIVTGFSSEVDDPVMRNASMVLLKPISLAVLEREVRRALEHP